MEFDFDVSKLCELEEDLSTVVPLVIGVLETSCYDAASGFFFGAGSGSSPETLKQPGTKEIIRI